MLYQHEKLDNSKVTRGHAKYRTISKVDKWLNSEGEKVSKKEIMKAMRQFWKSLDMEGSYKVTLSDYRNFGHWVWLKSYFIKFENSPKFQSLQPLCNYVLALCEEEKVNIAILRSERSFGAFIDIMKQRFHIDPVIFDSIKDEFKGVDNLEDGYQVSHENKEFFGTLVIHQYLLLVAILEQYYYSYYQFEHCPRLLNERKVIKRFLPTLKDEKITGSISKLIDKIFRESDTKTRADFYEILSNYISVEPESIERKITRWNTGESPVNPEEFNRLFKRFIGEDIPNEIIIACSISDALSRDLIKSSFSAEWVVNEFNKYSKYQSEIIEGCS